TRRETSKFWTFARSDYIVDGANKLTVGACMKFRHSILAFILFGTLIQPIFGQTFGEITGKITDASGAAVPEALVAATNVSTNAARRTIATDTGDYGFPSLPPGTYNVRVEKGGFKVDETRNVEVSVQQSVRLDFTLSV